MPDELISTNCTFVMPDGRLLTYNLSLHFVLQVGWKFGPLAIHDVGWITGYVSEIRYEGGMKLLYAQIGGVSVSKTRPAP